MLVADLVAYPCLLELPRAPTPRSHRDQTQYSGAVHRRTGLRVLCLPRRHHEQPDPLPQPAEQAECGRLYQTALLALQPAAGSIRGVAFVCGVRLRLRLLYQYIAPMRSGVAWYQLPRQQGKVRQRRGFDYRLRQGFVDRDELVGPGIISIPVREAKLAIAQTATVHTRAHLRPKRISKDSRHTSTHDCAYSRSDRHRPARKACACAPRHSILCSCSTPAALILAAPSTEPHSPSGTWHRSPGPRTCSAIHPRCHY
jgi:hypothetical protein